MELTEAVAAQARRARVATWLLWACAALAVKDLLTFVVLAGGGVLGPQRADGGSLLHGIADSVQPLVLLAAAFGWWAWAHRAYANLRLLGTGRTDASSAAAIYLWLIPILNLFRPFQLTRELWWRSREGNRLTESTERRSPGILWVWWGGLVGWVVLGAAAFTLLMGLGLHPLGPTTVGLLFIGSAGCSLTAAVAATRVVRQIDAFQRSAGSTPSERS